MLGAMSTVTATGKSSNKPSASTAGIHRRRNRYCGGDRARFCRFHAYLNGTVARGGTVTGAVGPTFNPQTDVSLSTSHDPTDRQQSTRRPHQWAADCLQGQRHADRRLGRRGDIHRRRRQFHAHKAGERADLALDPTGTNPGATQTLTSPKGVVFNLDSINSSQNTVRILQNGFNDGDFVTYNANGNANIQGLTSGASYKIHSSIRQFPTARQLRKCHPDRSGSGARGAHLYRRGRRRA